MRRLLILPIMGALVFGLALTAWAHSFTGTGDCDGWTLQLDGTWNAVEIFVDGQSIGLAQMVEIPDDSAATSRTFVVVWDKVNQRDVTRTLTVERSGECTPVPPPTTPESTTTTQPTEESSTTTTPPTTTLPSTTSSTTLAPTSTTPAPTTTAPTPSTTDPDLPVELPLTGIEGWLAFAALALIGAGWVLARGFRAED